jgi:hypothetical protein
VRRGCSQRVGPGPLTSGPAAPRLGKERRPPKPRVIGLASQRAPHPSGRLPPAAPTQRPENPRWRSPPRSSSPVPTRSPSATSARCAAASGRRSRTRARVCATRARPSSSRRARPARSDLLGPGPGCARPPDCIGTPRGLLRAAGCRPQLSLRCGGASGGSSLLCPAALWRPQERAAAAPGMPQAPAGQLRATTARAVPRSGRLRSCVQGSSLSFFCYQQVTRLTSAWGSGRTVTTGLLLPGWVGTAIAQGGQHGKCDERACICT